MSVMVGIPVAHRNSAWDMTLLAALFALFGYAYWQPFGVMFNWWQSEDFNYCFLLPPVLAHTLWTNRARLAAVSGPSSWQGLWFLAAGVLLYAVGEFGSEYYSLFLSSLLVLAGVATCLAGTRFLRELTFPCLLYWSMLPLPKFLSTKLSLQLQLVSSQLGELFIRALGMPVYREGNVIDLGFIQLQVVEACSGLRYLFPLIVLGLILAHYLRAARWAKAALVAAAVPTSILLNAVRLAITAVVAGRWGHAAVEGSTHDFAGWLVFLISFGLLYGLGLWLGHIAPAPPTVILSAGEPDTKPQVAQSHAPTPGLAGIPVPGLAATVLLVLMAVFVTGKGGQETPPNNVSLARFPMQIGEWRGKPNIMSADVLQALKLTEYVDADYTSPAGETVNLYIAYYRSQRKGEAIHSPETCLPGSGWRVEQEHDVVLKSGQAGPERVARRSLISKGRTTLLSYYWFQQHGRTFTSLPMLKLSTLWGAVARRRTDGAFVRVYVEVRPQANLEQEEKHLNEYIAAVLTALEATLPD